MFNMSSMFQELKRKRKGKIWELFRATDFESFMYPCFIFCRILGIFPYKINASTIKTCKPRYILSTISIGVFCILGLIHLYDINFSTSKRSLHEDIETSTKLQQNCFSIIGVFMAVTAFVLSGPRMRFLQTLLELSLKLPSESYQKLSSLIHVKDILGFFFLVVEFLIIVIKLQEMADVWQTSFLIYNWLLIFQMDMLYMNCVCILKACFKQINDNLVNLRKVVTNGEPYLLSGTYHEQRISFLLMEIIALKKQHLAISDAVQMLKMVFSLHLLSTILMTFTQIIFHLYFYLMQIYLGLYLSNEERQILRKACIGLVTYYSIKLVLIVWACETGKNQAMEISSTVHDVFNSASNKQIKYEMRLFSLQISHCENTFSAKGLTVDATLLTEIAGAIITYVLILIQFLFISSSCGGKTLKDTL
ncbi:putative gustatory receptor 28a [Temnothorax curvispinosus]|uniref:Gustatory receptor n=1 Tax=Temnothorax curvispinosus TaxID=300111 RepID=A0A6J1PTF5_9HYME|nr:putative gustatory receptor 28a [Temnothorax curvispinosus]